MLSPNQIQCLNEYYERTRTDLYFCCERHDCDYEQMQAIVAVIDPLMPGRNVDYIALLNGDPVASDPLLIQCNQTIGRLDEIYCQLRVMFQANHGEKQIHKRTTVNVPPDWANPSFSDGTFHHNTTHDGTEKIETTTMPSQERFKLLDSAMKCLDRSLRIQITLTNRKEKLQNRHRNQPEPHLTTNRKSSTRTEATSESPLRGLNAMRGIQSSPLAPRGDSRSENLPHNLSAPSASPRDPLPPVSQQESTSKSLHPQFSPPQGESAWETFIPLGMDNGNEEGPMEEWIYPTFAHPFGENEKVQLFPPFAQASPEDAEEIDAYLKSLPPEITADQDIGGHLNAYLVAPVIRTTQSEAEHTILHRREERIRARKQAESSPLAPRGDGRSENLPHNLSAPSASPRETSPPLDPTAQFGPPKEFTENTNIAAVRRHPYAWRKEPKATRAKIHLQSTPLAPRDEQSTSLLDKPDYYQRE